MLIIAAAYQDGCAVLVLAKMPTVRRGGQHLVPVSDALAKESSRLSTREDSLVCRRTYDYAPQHFESTVTAAAEPNMQSPEHAEPATVAERNQCGSSCDHPLNCPRHCSYPTISARVSKRYSFIFASVAASGAGDPDSTPWRVPAGPNGASIGVGSGDTTYKPTLHRESTPRARPRARRGGVGFLFSENEHLGFCCDVSHLLEH
jgi:hypothetical protein